MVLDAITLKHLGLHLSIVRMGVKDRCGWITENRQSPIVGPVLSETPLQTVADAGDRGKTWGWQRPEWTNYCACETSSPYRPMRPAASLPMSWVVVTWMIAK